MLLFRSEEHVQRWLIETDRPRGATMTLEQQWELARSWYQPRLEPGWRRFTPEEAEGIFGDIGLVGDFWKLT